MLHTLLHGVQQRVNVAAEMRRSADGRLGTIQCGFIRPAARPPTLLHDVQEQVNVVAERRHPQHSAHVVRQVVGERLQCRDEKGGTRLCSCAYEAGC